jgi:DNA sulfur modification protein DndD
VRLEHIRIKNFRQYYGEQTVRFSKNKEKNVTVIFGDNGSGKTTFLNAIQWCLYGKINLPKSDILVNERAEAEALEGDELEVYVEICFRDGVRDYTVLRRMAGTKDKGKIHVSSPSVVVSYIDESGRTITPNNPQNTIDQILPREMSAYFFFDGERIDNLSKDSGSEEIREAIKTIMGLKVLENSKRHLNDVRKIFADEVKASATGEIKGLILEREHYEDQIEELRNQITENEENRRAAMVTKNEIENKLRQAEETRQLQAERDRLNQDMDKVHKYIGEINQQIKRLCSKKGYLAFVAEVIEATKDILEEKRQKGEIPAGIKQQFVQDLLDRKRCICGTELVVGSEHYNLVESWLSQAGSKELEDKFTSTSAGVKLMEQYRPDLFAQLRELKNRKDTELEQLTSIREELDEIGVKLTEKDSEEIRKLERRRKELEDLIRDYDRKEGNYNGQIKQAQVHINKLNQEIEKCETLEAKASLAKNRMEACQKARDTIEAIHEEAAIKVKNDIQNRINEVYSHFLRKGYMAKLNEDYTLQIVKEFGETEKTVAMSQGERQITSLAFIGALVDTAREQWEKGKTRFFRGGIYPIVMDSPFGTLDPDHRRRIAQGIPSLSQQVVVLVSDSQWEGDVQKHLSTKIGAEYVLVNYSPKSPRTSQYEYTEIKEA